MRWFRMGCSSTTSITSSSGDLLAEVAINILRDVGVVLSDAGEVGHNEVKVIVGAEIRLIEDGVGIVVISCLEGTEGGAVGFPEERTIAIGIVCIVIGNTDSVKLRDIIGIALAQVGKDIVHHLDV